jgi:hypothetical protein
MVSRGAQVNYSREISIPVDILNFRSTDSSGKHAGDYFKEICGGRVCILHSAFQREKGMFLRLAVVGSGLLLLALIPALAEVVTSTSSRRGILHCLAAEELLAAGWLVPAEREFKRALKLQPLLGAARCGLGKVRLRQERYDDAVAEFRAAIEALHKVDRSMGRGEAPVPAALTLALAEALERSGRHSEAEQLRRSEASNHALSM